MPVQNYKITLPANSVCLLLMAIRRKQVVLEVEGYSGNQW
jgi:hypothetical protein